mgnify:CR=1 FL=1
MRELEPHEKALGAVFGVFLILWMGLIAMGLTLQEAKDFSYEPLEDDRPEVRYDEDLALKIKRINYETGEVEYRSTQPRTGKSRYEILINDRDILDKEALLEEIMDELDFWEMYDEYGAK